MPSAKYTDTYESVSKMGEKLKAAGKQGPTNDEQLQVRFLPHTYIHTCISRWIGVARSRCIHPDCMGGDGYKKNVRGMGGLTKCSFTRTPR